MSASGVGVIDTSSLWAAGSLVHNTGDAEFVHPSRQLYSTKHSYFLSLLHNLILYDELRTDFDILSSEDEWYAAPVRKLIDELSTGIKVKNIPQTINEQHILHAIADKFIEKTKAEFRIGRRPAGWEEITTGRTSYQKREPEFFEYGERYGYTPMGQEMYELARHIYGLRVEENADMGGKAAALLRNIIILARTIRYAAHSSFVQKSEERPSAFCAASGRIELLQDYLNAEYLKSIQASSAGFIDLFSKLGLPKSGYDFSGFPPSIKPITLSDLSLSVGHLEPKDALDRVLKLRSASEAKELRRIWAERLFNGGHNALEGTGHPTISGSISNVQAGGDVIQIIAVERLEQQQNIPANLTGGMTAGADVIPDLKRWVRDKLENR